MPISRIGTDGIDQTSSQQIGGISVGRGGGAVSTNTAVGASALTTNSSGVDATVVGYQAGYSSTGGYLTAVGYKAGYAVSSGTDNVFMGWNTGLSTTTGSSNVAMGDNAFRSNSTGGNNLALGHAALYSNTTASYNTAVGYQAGYSQTTAEYNTFIGYYAGRSTTGDQNTFIGKFAGNSVTTGTLNTIIGAYNGNQGGLDIRTASNYIVLSDGGGTPRAISTNNGTWLLAGKTSADGTSPGVMIEPDNGATSGRINIVKSYNGTTTAMAFYYSGAGVGTISYSNTATAYNTSSDYRLKENIQPMTGALATVAQLNPVTYNWKSDGSDGQGFIAHELQAVVPDAVTGEKDAVDEDGNPVYQGIDTSFLVATLTAAIKELKAEFDAYKEAHP